MCHDNFPALSIIGVGPGDPEMLTLKAIKRIKSCQVIFAPCSAIKKDSLALEILLGAFQPGEIKAEIVNQVYPMSRDQKLLADYWDRASIEVAGKLEEGKRCVFITLGDPSLYSTWSYLRPRLEERHIPYEIIPGIPSFFMGAARVGRELAIGEERLAVIPMPESREELERLMEQFNTLVLMKIGKAMDRLKHMLDKAGYLESAWIISRAGLPGERVMPMKNIIDDGMGYLSHVIVYKDTPILEEIL